MKCFICKKDTGKEYLPYVVSPSSRLVKKPTIGVTVHLKLCLDCRNENLVLGKSVDSLGYNTLCEITWRLFGHWHMTDDM